MLDVFRSTKSTFVTGSIVWLEEIFDKNVNIKLEKKYFIRMLITWVNCSLWVPETLKRIVRLSCKSRNKFIYLDLRIVFKFFGDYFILGENRVHWQQQPGSLARTCNVATDRLVYQDVRGLSATEPCPKARIWGRIKPKDTGTQREPGLVSSPRLVCLRDQTGPT